MSGLIGGRKSKRSEWDQETAFLVDCGTSPTERDSVDWPWTGEEATTPGWVGETGLELYGMELLTIRLYHSNRTPIEFKELYLYYPSVLLFHYLVQ